MPLGFGPKYAGLGQPLLSALPFYTNPLLDPGAFKIGDTIILKKIGDTILLIIYFFLKGRYTFQTREKKYVRKTKIQLGPCLVV